MSHYFAHATDICTEVHKHLIIHEGKPQIRSDAILRIQEILKERFDEKRIRSSAKRK